MKASKDCPGFSSTGSLVYFDTNVFDPRDGIPEAEESLVLDAIFSQRFRLVFDLDCFLEPLIAFREPSKEGRRLLGNSNES